ncbi:hypothetical protein AB0K15_46425 [Amycolatopsis sp. NPDC049253]|uniref:hypothetical protein n=1 Tax=Amycolatopsis sp. NPDC049253 TaxID=3155274 RepID=UPI00341632FC
MVQLFLIAVRAAGSVMVPAPTAFLSFGMNSPCQHQITDANFPDANSRMAHNHRNEPHGMLHSGHPAGPSPAARQIAAVPRRTAASHTSATRNSANPMACRPVVRSTLWRKVWLNSPVLLVRGIAQVGQDTVPLVADHATPLDLKSLASGSRDFRQRHTPPLPH